MKSLRSILASTILLVNLSFAQPPRVEKVEPPHWWAGMKLNKIQLMLYGENLTNATITSSSPSITIVNTHQLDNASYLFVDVIISPRAEPGDYQLNITSPRGKSSFTFPLMKRRASTNEHQGFSQADVIYLIVPDRFANGDTTNDLLRGTPVPHLDTLNRADPYSRHGGDLQGIINKLDYLNELGVTALWLTPVVENNGRQASYHGYATTDLYKIDARFGSNELYATFVREAHKRKLKVIMDHVSNHFGINHPWIKNLPMPDWLNGSPANHQKPYHGKLELDDINSDSLTKQKATRGWFADYMPDFNQANPFVANYLIQSTIWWIEFSGIDGIREDTYPYINEEFRERWCKTILNEYPRFNIVGEVWVQDPAYLAPYQRGSALRKRVAPELPAVTDFGLFDAFMKAFVDSTGSIDAVFNCLTKDFLFPDPTNLVTHLDNHDIRRIMYNVKGDVKRFKLALMTLLTTRGIPQILYGTELGMMGGPDHGRLRADFPGGWQSDARDAFTEQGRTAQENDIFNFTKQLLQLRKRSAPLQTGKLIHFKPMKEAYVYFRILNNERIMVIINRNKEKQVVNLAPFEHQLINVSRVRELISGQEFDLSGKKEIPLDGMTGGIFEIGKESQ